MQNTIKKMMADNFGALALLGMTAWDVVLFLRICVA